MRKAEIPCIVHDGGNGDVRCCVHEPLQGYFHGFCCDISCVVYGKHFLFYSTRCTLAVSGLFCTIAGMAHPRLSACCWGKNKGPVFASGTFVFIKGKFPCKTLKLNPNVRLKESRVLLHFGKAGGRASGLCKDASCRCPAT